MHALDDASHPERPLRDQHPVTWLSSRRVTGHFTPTPKLSGLSTASSANGASHTPPASSTNVRSSAASAASSTVVPSTSSTGRNRPSTYCCAKAVFHTNAFCRAPSSARTSCSYASCTCTSRSGSASATVKRRAGSSDTVHEPIPPVSLARLPVGAATSARSEK
ncbi:MAG: hypothetical protein AB1689_26375 [Thermodesulfobacteriota bacterium]